MRGPILQPVKVESWNQFVSAYGDYIAPGYLAYSVYGFFANGGRTAWICRVADITRAAVASGSFGGVKIFAGTPGTWGNAIYVEPLVSGSDIAAILIRFPDGTEQFLRPPFQPTPSLTIQNLFEIAQLDIDSSLAVPALVTPLTIDLPTTLPQPGYLRGGADGLASLTTQHFLDAFDSFVKIAEIGIVAAPDLMPKLSVLPRFKKPPATCCVQPGVFLRPLHHLPRTQSFLPISPQARFRICRSLSQRTPNPCVTASPSWMAATNATLPHPQSFGANLSAAPVLVRFIFLGFIPMTRCALPDFSAPCLPVAISRASSRAAISTKASTSRR